MGRGVRAQLDEADGDQEEQMNLLRDVHHAQVFRLLVADLDGRLTVERLADHLSALADATLGARRSSAPGRPWRAAPRRAARSPSIAYGKLGGKELGYASDLDLIFLFDDAAPDAPRIYSTLARRLVTWLTTQTSSGILFDIDLRLRPNGNAGLMVSSFDAFSRYQRNEDGLGAWVWETPGAHARALFARRRCAGRSASRTIAPGSCARARDLADTAQAKCWRCARRCSTATPTERCSTSSTTAAAWSTSSSSCSTWCSPMRTRARELIAQRSATSRCCTWPARWPDRHVARASGGRRVPRRSVPLQHRLRLNGAERARVEPEEVVRDVDAVRRLWHQVFDA